MSKQYLDGLDIILTFKEFMVRRNYTGLTHTHTHTADYQELKKGLRFYSTRMLKKWVCYGFVDANIRREIPGPEERTFLLIVQHTA